MSKRRRVIVGVTGHRPNRLAHGKIDRIRRDIANTLAKLEKTHPGSHFRLATGLAEGADRLTAFAALGAGWELSAILAFHRSRFEEDFPEADSTGEFRALLKSASDVVEPSPRWHRRRPAEDGYSAVGDWLVEKSDILLAIWDGQPSQGRGGTVDVMDRARDKGVPVIWIDATGVRRPKTLRPRKAKRTASRK